jgi:hypothetical protein
LFYVNILRDHELLFLKKLTINIKGKLDMEPPKKDSEPTPENIQKLEQWLTSIIAGHPGADHTYTFYEEIDRYLGPWGQDGYPIAYGKRYNILFTTDSRLMSNMYVRQWVWRTTIRLQEDLRDYIIQAYKDGLQYPSSNTYLTPARFKRDLKEAAFNSHAKAYVSGGLTIVALLAPNLIDDIAAIPRKEFSPLSTDFNNSVQQVLAVVERVIPEIAGVALATAAGPSHTIAFRHAQRMDMNTIWGHKQVIDSLHRLKAAINQRTLDVPPTLDEIIKRLNAREYPDMQTADLARRVIQAAEKRKKALAQIYIQEVGNDPLLWHLYDNCLEGWSK